MKTAKIALLAVAIAISCLAIGTSVSAQSVPQVQTSSATNVQNGFATLNGELMYLGNYGFNNTTNVYFQYGLNTSYGNQTALVMQNNIGTFSQTVSGLTSYATYHYRAVAQNSYGTTYGVDMVFTTGQTGIYNGGGINCGTNNVINTTLATYVSNNQATLNAYLPFNDNSMLNSVFFQWGPTVSYGSGTSLQYSAGQGATFSQNVQNLNSGTLYHFRAAMSGNCGTFYGQDMTFTTSGSPSSIGGTNSSLSISKKVINLSAGNLVWAQSVAAKQGDVISFAITLQAVGQDQHNVTVRDILPAALVMRGNPTVNLIPNSGNIANGLNVGTIGAGQFVVVSYQAQVASANYGTTSINNNAIVTSDEAGTQNASASVLANTSLVYGASTVATGLTNYLFADSFLIPLLTIVFGLWFYFSGEAYVFADKLKGLIKK